MQKFSTSTLLLIASFVAGAWADEPVKPSPDAAAALAVFRDYNDAMMRGDEEAMGQHNHVVSDRDRQFSNAQVAADAAIGKLKAAAQEKFGGDAGKRVGKANGDISNDDLENAMPVITGDRATVLSVPMLKVEGKWKFDLGIGSASEQQVNEQITSYRQRTALALELAQDVKADKFKSVDELLAAVAARRI